LKDIATPSEHEGCIGIVAGDGADMRLALVENGRSQDSWPLLQTVKARFAEASDWATTEYTAATQGIAETMKEQSNSWVERSRSGLADFANTIQTTVNPPQYGFMSGWLEQHPIIHWMVDHPLGAAALLILALVLLGGLFRAIAYTTEQLWLAILRLPMQLGRWAWRLISGSSKPAIAQPVLPSGAEEQHRERLTYVLHRLDAIKQEQDRLLKELQELLG
jgi:hypothetical protein